MRGALNLVRASAFANWADHPLPSPSAIIRFARSQISSRRSCHRLSESSDAQVLCDMTFCPANAETVPFVCPFGGAGLSQPGWNPDMPNHVPRRPLQSPDSYKALLVDAAGTLIKPSQSTAQVYHEIGLKYGVKFTEKEIAARYRSAYGHLWCRYRLRYEEDGRLFWQLIVEEATGCKDPALLEDLYEYYITPQAWHIGDPEAGKALKAIRRAGIKLAVVSNFDTRLRPLMRALQCYEWFDAVVVSAEVGAEKPNPAIFRVACEALGVRCSETLHVGDDRRNDIVGASLAGCDSLHWGTEINSFSEIAGKLGVSTYRERISSRSASILEPLIR